MNATAEQTRDALRALYSREPSEIIDDLRSVSQVMNRALGLIDNHSLRPGALTMLESQNEGIRNLLRQLRTSLGARGIQ